MKMTKMVVVMVCVVGLLSMGADSCEGSSRKATQEVKDSAIVQNQQSHYAKAQPLPMYDYSLPRDVVIQIYNVVTQEARSTYTVVMTMTGVVTYHGPSLGYGIPADVSLTNPLQMVTTGYGEGRVSASIEQPEPSGLFSSKNTDGTWVLFVDDNGDIAPIYTENKVTTFPFMVEQRQDGSWARVGTKQASMVVKVGGQGNE